MKSGNPGDVLQNFHETGAIFDLPNPLRATQAEVAFGAAPFDWSTTVDAEQSIAAAIAQPGFKLPVNNQGASGSCGGQADEKVGEILKAILTKNFTRMSAKFTYAPVSYPGGGTTDGDLVVRTTGAGWGTEGDTPSYQNGNPPTEQFMETVADITPKAMQDAIIEQALAPVYINLDIDSIAQAIRDYHAVRLGLCGSNNGTWLSATPVPPTATEQIWSHFMCFCKAEMRNGKKSIGAIQSWGAAGVGDPSAPGIQWLDESYFGVQLPQGVFGQSIWRATAYLYNENPATTLHYAFTKPLLLGQSGEDVVALQRALQVLGFFPAAVPCTGYYGAITAAAVLAFGLKYQVSDVATLKQLAGARVGALTLAQLNKLFNA